MTAGLRARSLEVDEVYSLDVDDDGVDELLTLDRTAREIRHFRAQGLGIHAAIESFPLELDYPAEPNLDAFVFDDLGDGDPDLFVVDRGFVWLLHDKAGTLVFEPMGVQFSGVELRPLTTYWTEQVDGEFDDANARLRSWPLWDAPTTKADALAGIEQGARIDEEQQRMARLWVRAGAVLTSASVRSAIVITSSTAPPRSIVWAFVVGPKSIGSRASRGRLR